MNDSYPTDGPQVKPVVAAPVKLSLCLNTVPQAYIPLTEAVRVLGVSIEQASAWCQAGNLPALELGGIWWITAADLTSFVARSTWRLSSVPGR